MDVEIELLYWTGEFESCEVIGCLCSGAFERCGTEYFVFGEAGVDLRGRIRGCCDRRRGGRGARLTSFTFWRRGIHGGRGLYAGGMAQAKKILINMVFGAFGWIDVSYKLTAFGEEV